MAVVERKNGGNELQFRSVFAENKNPKKKLFIQFTLFFNRSSSPTPTPNPIDILTPTPTPNFAVKWFLYP
ncbi:MAG: hypothetical protein GY755_02145 [Chloroflexi bacterium]|nr:hypothetical protein [Chloroflexota bacterium]